MIERFAILMDGGFVTKQLQLKLGYFPKVEDVKNHAETLRQHDRLKGLELLRLYFYDAPPFEGKSTNPISKKTINFSETPIANRHRSLLDTLDLSPDVAVRRGLTIMGGWQLGRQALADLGSHVRPITADDLEPAIKQKGVDLRIGLDMASIALKRIVGTVVLVSGDSDLVPAMKFVRKEGIRVYLDPLGSSNVRQEMRIHADFVF
ncbi:MAG TPA: NYN domain-containing protein [Thermoanaerobaculaceae bacterium]|nr:NYN domain-containing protein [Thermoanaerobaculaceae bacterium]